MPLGLFTNCEVSAPCGLCSTEGVIGLLDVPDFFLDPDRVAGRAGLVRPRPRRIQVPEQRQAPQHRGGVASSSRWSFPPRCPAPISTGRPTSRFGSTTSPVGTWTSPGDYGDKRGVYTPSWWKLEGSQYGKLKTWRISEKGSFIDGVRISEVTIDDLDLPKHHSIRMRIGIDAKAEHPGGVNIFGKGFGNYDQDIVMRLLFERPAPLIRADETSRASSRTASPVRRTLSTPSR